jgi:hypothetical protein
MSFLSYGSMNGPDGPVVQKRFFGNHVKLLHAMSMNAGELGIGTASGVSEVGLAALEAYAAVMEVCCRLCA